MERWHALTERLAGVGAWVAPLGLRILLAWEFFEAGREKLHGENWFTSIQTDFPFPFSVMPAELSWTMATWSELLLSVALLVGFGTRFAAFGLFVLTVVATAAVHWPDDWMGISQLLQGYAISDMGRGNYKLPVIYLAMLLPLIFLGAGKLSVDALIGRAVRIGETRPFVDMIGWGIVLVALGLPIAMLLPVPGLALAGLGISLLVLRVIILR
ncbi:MAG: DoxX family protein [Lysobacterales bacterium]